MARHSNVIRSASLHLHIPEDLKARLDLLLWSDLEQRVPLGAYQRLFIELLNQYFTKLETLNGS